MPNRSSSQSPHSQKANPEQKTADRSPTALGTCPLCEGDVVEQKKSYSCANWQSGCKFVIWKTIAKKTISVSMAKSLLKKGETQLLKGFRSKAGKTFSARLRLENGEVRLNFDT